MLSEEPGPSCHMNRQVNLRARRPQALVDVPFRTGSDEPRDLTQTEFNQISPEDNRHQSPSHHLSCHTKATSQLSLALWLRLFDLLEKSN
jgi:hypothetical protein